jgi:hypothetical protein
MGIFNNMRLKSGFWSFLSIFGHFYRFLVHFIDFGVIFGVYWGGTPWIGVLGGYFSIGLKIGHFKKVKKSHRPKNVIFYIAFCSCFLKNGHFS